LICPHVRDTDIESQDSAFERCDQAAEPAWQRLCRTGLSCGASWAGLA
jgi:hypothetical protein